MIPAIAFRSPDYFTGLIQIAAITFAAVVDKRFTCFINNYFGVACLCINLYNLVNLVPALIKFKGKSLTAFSPFWIGESVLILKIALINRNLFQRFHIE